MERRRITSGTEWESQVGYSRAVRVESTGGNRVLVSGTTATDDDGNVCAPGEPAEQTRIALENVADALREANSGLDDVVRTRLYVTDIEMWKAVGAVHGDVFGDVQPASTLIEVGALIEPELVVEIEAEAVVNSG
jgi:enamine deaminase RidA (YjgF/YER057c/UK114 family)